MRTLFLVGTTLAKGWLFCRSWYEYMTQSVSRFTRHMIHYFEDHTWYLLHSGIPVYSGHSLHLPEAVWHMKGVELHRVAEPKAMDRYAVKWLSATLLVRSTTDESCTEEYEMDSFLEYLRVFMSSTDSITLHDLFMAWCIHTQRWISSHRVQIRYYDEEGEEHTVSILHSNAPEHRVPCRRMESKKKEPS